MMNGLTLIPLATAILLTTHANPAFGQQSEKKEGTILSIDTKKKTVELGWEVIEFEQAGGTKAQPIQIPKAVRVEKATFPVSEKMVVCFTQAPIFVDANGKERKATSSEYSTYRGNGNQPGFKPSPDAVLKNRSVTLLFRKDEVAMILVTGSEKIEVPAR